MSPNFLIALRPGSTFTHPEGEASRTVVDVVCDSDFDPDKSMVRYTNSSYPSHVFSMTVNSFMRWLGTIGED